MATRRHIAWSQAMHALRAERLPSPSAALDRMRRVARALRGDGTLHHSIIEDPQFYDQADVQDLETSGAIRREGDRYDVAGRS